MESEIVTEREIMTELLEQYKEFRCLWDTGDPKYSNKVARKGALDILTSIYARIEKSATVDKMKRKLENLRAAYKRERRKVEDTTRTGSGSSEIYNPTLWYYDLLCFLDEKDLIIRHGRETEEDSIQNVDEEAETESTFSENNTTETIKQDGNPPTKKRRMISSSRLQKKQEALMDAAQALLSKPDEPTEAYAHGLALQLKQMSYHQRCIAERLISDVLFHGKMSTLSFETSLVGTNSPPIYIDPNNLYATSSSNSCPSSSALSYSVTPSPNENTSNPFIIIQEDSITNNPVSEFLQFTKK